MNSKELRKKLNSRKLNSLAGILPDGNLIVAPRKRLLPLAYVWKHGGMKSGDERDLLGWEANLSEHLGSQPERYSINEGDGIHPAYWITDSGIIISSVLDPSFFKPALKGKLNRGELYFFVNIKGLARYGLSSFEKMRLGDSAWEFLL